MPLYDPMCGSGTFLIEGAQIAAGIAPGFRRSFAFQRWPRYRDGLWQNLLLEAKRNEAEPKFTIAGSDIDPEVVAVAQRNSDRAGVGGVVRVEPRNIRDLMVPSPQGLVLCNPPYGQRIGDESSLRQLYRKIGGLYSEQFKGWRGALFCPSEDMAAETGLNPEVVAKLENGGIKTSLFAGKL